MPPPLSELAFGALLAYSPRGVSKESQRSKALGLQLKGNRFVGASPPATAADFIVLRMVARLAETPLAGFFSLSDLLVPVPTSGLLQPDSVWPALAVCQAMAALGLGRDVRHCLERRAPIRKSAFAAPGERPDLAEHLASLAVHPPVAPPPRILLVDDFVTKGTTLLAAACALHETLPSTPIAAFAVFRTLGLQPEIERLMDPCVGRIWIEGETVRREP